VRGDGLTARFYRTVDVVPAPQARKRALLSRVRCSECQMCFRSLCAQGGGYHVRLDGRTLRTPARGTLLLPSLPLALAVAAEWEWQDARTLRPFTMPIMVRQTFRLPPQLPLFAGEHARPAAARSDARACCSGAHTRQSLCATAIDRIPSTRDTTVESLLRFFQTDALCVRSDAPALAAAQATAWDPLLEWVGAELGGRPAASSSLFGPPHPEAATAAMRAALDACDDWQLAGVSALSAAARSLVMAFALARRRVRAADAPTLLRIEEDAQAAEWGFVEGGHDVDIADLRARIAAPAVFLDLLRADAK
jgi:ATP synthase F1 complex assembly factor 2